MEIVLAAAALGVAILTLYSGFGLGTLLLPVLLFFYPPEVAVAATAVVHLLNNLLKVALVGRFADRKILWRFALPAIPAAFVGAWLLHLLAGGEAVARYTVGSRDMSVTPIGLVVGALIVLFAVLDLAGVLKKRALPPRLLPLGGLMSGFFGGLSGHQGALRSLVLVRLGLDKTGYIGTAVSASTLVDLTRLAVYGTAWIGSWDAIATTYSLRPLLIAVGAAFLGTFIGLRLLGKVTLAGLHRLIGILLLVAGLAIASGLGG